MYFSGVVVWIGIIVLGFNAEMNSFILGISACPEVCKSTILSKSFKKLAVFCSSLYPFHFEYISQESSLFIRF